MFQGGRGKSAPQTVHKGVKKTVFCGISEPIPGCGGDEKPYERHEPHEPRKMGLSGPPKFPFFAPSLKCFQFCELKVYESYFFLRTRWFFKNKKYNETTINLSKIFVRQMASSGRVLVVQSTMLGCFFSVLYSFSSPRYDGHK